MQRVFRKCFHFLVTIFQPWRNMMTLTPNLRKIVCLVTVDLVCLLLVGVPCLLLWLVGKITVMDQNIPVRFKSRRSILSWILLQRRDPSPSLQRLNGPNMGSCCRQLWIANHRLQVGFTQQTNALLFVFLSPNSNNQMFFLAVLSRRAGWREAPLLAGRDSPGILSVFAQLCC